MSKYSAPRSLDTGARYISATSSATYPSSSATDSAPETIFAKYSANGTTGDFNRADLLVKNTVARTRRSPGASDVSQPTPSAVSSLALDDSVPFRLSSLMTSHSSSHSSPPSSRSIVIEYPGGSATTTSISFISYPISHRRTMASSVLDTRCTAPSAPRVPPPNPIESSPASTSSSDAYPPLCWKTSLRLGALATAEAVGPIPRLFSVYGLMFAPKLNIRRVSFGASRSPKTRSWLAMTSMSTSVFDVEAETVTAR
mmetsp:Transcript_14153/g.38890  ORF Transcript_14153/g.38890 Transcript_14153/m.38890 type:complete len:256 (-) Transcript_14153:147-914(-)